MPVCVKDILDVAGLPTRWGSRLMAQAPPAKSDIAAVARLRAAGAVVIGKTTTTEFAHSPLGFSPLTGLTRNPWAPELTCGGSSAGAGVAAAAGLSSLSLATDAGCSTRLPAACTGIFGIKPTLGTAPHDRVPEAFANFIHLGLLARTVTDLAVGLDVIAGACPVDPHSLTRAKPNAVAALVQKTMDGARVLLWMRTGNLHVADEIIAATRKAAAVLASLGARVTEEACPLENPDPVWRILQQSNWAARFAALKAEDRSKLSPTLNAGIEAGLAYRGLDLQRALIKRTELFRAVQTVFQNFDFILTPCVSAPPVAADHDLAAPLIIDGKEAGVDQLNIFHANLLAMQRAILALEINPDHVLVDGKHCPKISCSAEAIVQGDRKIAAIAAASILAKVTRDRELIALDKQYPNYGFAIHRAMPQRNTARL